MNTAKDEGRTRECSASDTQLRGMSFLQEELGTHGRAVSKGRAGSARGAERPCGEWARRRETGGREACREAEMRIQVAEEEA